jgi:polyhydroxyalkanoate synthesis regulator phasin
MSVQKKLVPGSIVRGQSMFDVLKQSVLASVGLAMMTADKVAEFAADIAERSNLTKQQAHEFQEELGKRAEQARHDLQAEIDRRIDHAFIQLGIAKAGIKKDVEEASVKGQSVIEQSLEKALERLGIARTEDIEALANRIDILEKRVR